MSVYFVISVLIIFLIILLIILMIINKIVISRKKIVYLSLIALFFAFFIKSAVVEKNEQIKTQVLEMVPTLKAINQVDPVMSGAFFADFRNAGKGSKKREEYYMRLQQWATENIKKTALSRGG
ncbi:hypothetical protein OND84_001167 [Morganella morganii]